MLEDTVSNVVALSAPVQITPGEAELFRGLGGTVGEQVMSSSTEGVINIARNRLRTIRTCECLWGCFRPLSSMHSSVGDSVAVADDGSLSWTACCSLCSHEKFNIHHYEGLIREKFGRCGWM